MIFFFVIGKSMEGVHMELLPQKFALLSNMPNINPDPKCSKPVK